MTKAKQFIAIGLVGLFMAALGGGGVWWWLKDRLAAKSATAEQAPAASAYDKQEYKYLSLDKVIVMLRSEAGVPQSHYLAVDLVFKTPAEKERIVKDHLPLLRSIVVTALSTYPLEKVSQMSIEQLTQEINAAYQASYERDRKERPFVEALIGKLIIE